MWIFFYLDCPFIVKVFDSSDAPITVNPRGLLAPLNFLSWFLVDVKRLQIDSRDFKMFITGLLWLIIICLVVCESDWILFEVFTFCSPRRITDSEQNSTSQRWKLRDGVLPKGCWPTQSTFAAEQPADKVVSVHCECIRSETSAHEDSGAGHPWAACQLRRCIFLSLISNIFYCYIYFRHTTARS